MHLHSKSPLLKLSACAMPSHTASTSSFPLTPSSFTAHLWHDATPCIVTLLFPVSISFQIVVAISGSCFFFRSCYQWISNRLDFKFPRFGCFQPYIQIPHFGYFRWSLIFSLGSFSHHTTFFLSIAHHTTFFLS